MTLINDGHDNSLERALHMDRAETVKQEEISVQGLDTKTDILTERHSQCDFYFGLSKTTAQQRV
jgi:hypothetical protein